MGVIGTFFVSDKFANSLGWFLFILTASIFVIQLIFLLAIGFTYPHYATWQLIFEIVFSVVTLIITVLTFYRISKMEVMYQNLDAQSKPKLAFILGLEILNMFIWLFYYLLNILSWFRN
ncbi:hypothetical protein UREOM_3210 [Ureaplasma sp. OM1]|uniref:Uncharacterized protein n=2 Tax=Ureaplasma ceti TaxID=3119530 RepID=A0ABP9U5J9_9BACT